MEDFYIVVTCNYSHVQVRRYSIRVWKEDSIPNKEKGYGIVYWLRSTASEVRWVGQRSIDVIEIFGSVNLGMQIWSTKYRCLDMECQYQDTTYGVDWIICFYTGPNIGPEHQASLPYNLQQQKEIHYCSRNFYIPNN